MARILLIDDEEIVRFTLRTALEMGLHKVVEAEDGEQATELLSESSFDLVITDIVMPKKEGVQTILDIKANYPDTKIIAITGGDPARSGLYLKTAGILGADKVLLKPISDAHLTEAIDTCLSGT